MTGKLKGGLFLWCCYNNAVGEILARYEREKDIRKVVIKIHTMKIADGLLQSKRCPFVFQKMLFCGVKDALLQCKRAPFRKTFVSL